MFRSHSRLQAVHHTSTPTDLLLFKICSIQPTTTRSSSRLPPRQPDLFKLTERRLRSISKFNCQWSCDYTLYTLPNKTSPHTHPSRILPHRYATNDQLTHPYCSPALSPSLGGLPPLFIVRVSYRWSYKKKSNLTLILPPVSRVISLLATRKSYAMKLFMWVSWSMNSWPSQLTAPCTSVDIRSLIVLLIRNGIHCVRIWPTHTQLDRSRPNTTRPPKCTYRSMVSITWLCRYTYVKKPTDVDPWSPTMFVASHLVYHRWHVPR